MVGLFQLSEWLRSVPGREPSTQTFRCRVAHGTRTRGGLMGPTRGSGQSTCGGTWGRCHGWFADDLMKSTNARSGAGSRRRPG
jgi:hypothetical protein